MKTSASLMTVLAFALAAQLVHTAQAQVSTAITYQGQAFIGGLPASGMLDARFTLYDASLGGNQVGVRLCANDVAVADGRFTTLLDFGDEYSRNAALFLEVELRVDTGQPCTNPAGFVVLGPRQPLSATPYAVYANNALAAESAANANLLGGLSSAFFRSASNLNAGTLADARLSTNIPRLNAANTFTAPVTISNPLSTLAGSGGAIVGLSATNITGGVLGIGQGGTGASTTGAATGSVLKFSGTTWQPGADQDTTYTAGTGLSLTGTTFSIPSQGIVPGMLGTNSVDTFAIAPDAIISSDISNFAVTSTKIANDAVTASKLADGAVSGGVGGAISDGSIGNADLQANIISSSNIIDGAIASIDILPGAVAGGTQGPIADNTVASIDILDATVTSADIAVDTIQAVDIATDAIGALEIAPSAVGSVELSSNAASLQRVSGGSMQTDGTRVGIGGAPTTNELFVNGRVETTTGLTTTGTVTAAEFVHANPFPRVYSVGVYDFVREDGGISFHEYNGSDRLGDPLLANTSFVSVSAGAPVHLPDGAVVTGFEAFVQDDASADMTIQLLRRSHTESPGGTMAQIITSGESLLFRQFTDNTISGATINNALNQYIVRIQIPVTTNALNFRGAVIRYSVARPLP